MIRTAQNAAMLIAKIVEELNETEPEEALSLLNRLVRLGVEVGCNVLVGKGVSEGIGVNIGVVGRGMNICIVGRGVFIGVEAGYAKDIYENSQKAVERKSILFTNDSVY